MKKTIFAFIAVIMLLSVIATVSISATTSSEAEDISRSVTVSGTGYNSFGFLTDGNQNVYLTSAKNAVINITGDNGIGSLYIMFTLSPEEYVIEDIENGKTVIAGEYGFLHEYIDVSALFGYEPKSISIKFSSSVRMSEIYVFTKGETPSFVQKWQPPLEDNTDLLICATHGDDDQLFFAGLMPYYAVYKDYRVQVAYLTDHRNLTEGRTHEMLNGLWAVGITAYPVFGTFADFRIDSLEGTYNHYKTLGTTRDDLLSFVTELLRRFNPLVVAGHDFKGEYGHGMHQAYADLLSEAITISGNAEKFPESAEKYGVWDVQKAYFHLYGENQIVMDFDTPQDCFDGLSAFQVSQKKGYPCHVSQQYTWFTQWLNGYSGEITKATQIKDYNPCEYGLYFSSVGDDVNKNDMFENIVTYGEQERIEQEKAEQSIADELSRQEEQSRLQEQSVLDEQSRLNELSTEQSVQTQTSNIDENVVESPKQIILIVLVCIAFVCVVTAFAVAAKKRK